jgi:eukaryotic-like serine/threonine-protein kinase
MVLERDPGGRIIRGGAWGENNYEYGNIRHAPAMDRSAKNGFRCALYPHPEASPRRLSRSSVWGALSTSVQYSRLPDPIFEIYKEQFSYDKTELNARVESREENPGGWIHEKVSFDAAYSGERVLAHLFLP